MRVLRPGASDHQVRPTPSLTSRTVSGFLVSGLAKGILVFVHFGVLAVLARLVEPSEFGLITAAMVVVSFCTQLVDIGLTPALIQLERLGQRHLDAVLTLSA